MTSRHPTGSLLLARLGSLTQKHAYPTRFLAIWQKGESEPWLLATNLASARQTCKLYAVRMWIEEMFADFKGHGFDLEASRLNISCACLA